MKSEHTGSFSFRLCRESETQPFYDSLHTRTHLEQNIKRISSVKTSSHNEAVIQVYPTELTLTLFRRMLYRKYLSQQISCLYSVRCRRRRRMMN